MSSHLIFFPQRAIQGWAAPRSQDDKCPTVFILTSQNVVCAALQF